MIMRRFLQRMTTEPVSYTHLYLLKQKSPYEYLKEQKGMTAQTTANAVSYTHLDVYKRQVTIQLDREVDVSRGCVLTIGSGAKVASSITATILWMDDDELFKRCV